MSNRQRRIRDRSAESWGLAMRALGFETVALALTGVAAAACCVGCDRSLSEPPALQVGADNRSDDYSGKPDELPEPKDSYLTPDERVILFDLERSDLLLEKCLQPFFEAIRQGDAAGARTALAAEFQCQLPTLPAVGEPAVDASSVYGFMRLASGGPGGADDLSRWVEDLRRRFDKIETVSFGRKKNSRNIIDGPGAVAESSGAFRIAGQRHGDMAALEISGQFVLRHDGFDRFAVNETTANAGARAESRQHWIHQLTLQDVRIVCLKSALFEEVTESCGVDVKRLHDNWRDRRNFNTTQTGCVALGDVSRDGHLDMIVTDLDQSWLYLGNGDGTFVDSGWHPVLRTPRQGILGLMFDCVAIFDATGDGWPDVLHSGFLYRWDAEAGTLVVISRATKLPNENYALCDYDRDGRTDIYVLNSGPRSGRATRAFFDDDRVNGAANQLFRNRGNGHFQDVTASANASPGKGRTFASTWFYANSDAWPDLFGANEFGRNVFLINQGNGRFEETPDVDTQFGGFSMGVVSGDLDDDGKVDLYVSNMYSKAGHRVFHHLDLERYPKNARRMFMASIGGNRFYRNRGDLTFDDLSKSGGVHAVGWAWSGATADFDLDGLLDIYAPCGHTSRDAKRPDG